MIDGGVLKPAATGDDGIYICRDFDGAIDEEKSIVEASEMQPQ